MKKYFIIFMSLSITFISACDKEKTFVWESWLTPSTEVAPDDPKSLIGHYDIISFKHENASECISYTAPNEEVAYSRPCSDTGKIIRGKMVIKYDESLSNAFVSFKYDIYENTDSAKNPYHIDYKYNPNNAPFSFKITGELDFINNDSQRLTNATTNDTIEIKSFTYGRLLPQITLSTNNGADIYTFALKKENDLSMLYNTHTAIDINNNNTDFSDVQKPINLDPNAVQSKGCNSDTNPLGCFDPFGLFGYYKIQKLEIFNKTDLDNPNKTPVYSTDNISSGKKFYGEFWINQPRNFLTQISNSIVNLSAYIKYQIEDDPNYPLPNGVMNSILTPRRLLMALPLQNTRKDGSTVTEFNEMILQTFSLLAEWNKNSLDRTRQVIYSPRLTTFDNLPLSEQNILFLDDDSNYAAVLTIEQLYQHAYSDNTTTATDMINYNNKPYF